jgi:hypothetical protein
MNLSVRCSLSVLRFIQDPGSPPSRRSAFSTFCGQQCHLSTHTSLWGVRLRVIQSPTHYINRACRLAFKILAHLFLIHPTRSRRRNTVFILHTINFGRRSTISFPGIVTLCQILLFSLLEHVHPTGPLRRFPGVDLSETCSDFRGHPMARNVGRPARDTLLTDSSLPYLSARTKFLTWALSGEVLLGHMSSYNYLISKAVNPLRVCHTRSS